MNIRIDLNLDFKNVEGVVNLLSKYMNLDTNTNNKTNILTNYLTKNKFEYRRQIIQAIKNINQEMKEAEDEFSKLFNTHEYEK